MKVYHKKASLMAIGAGIFGLLHTFFPGNNFAIGSMILIYLASIEIIINETTSKSTPK